MKTLALTLSIILLVISIGCKVNPFDFDGTTSTSGIEGTVLMGPICPVQTYPNSCPDEPFSALFHVFDQAGTEVTTFQSDEQGQFRVALSPGEYTIIADEAAPLHPKRQSENVTVTSGSFTLVTLVFDTGIR